MGKCSLAGILLLFVSLSHVHGMDLTYLGMMKDRDANIEVTRYAQPICLVVPESVTACKPDDPLYPIKLTGRSMSSKAKGQTKLLVSDDRIKLSLGLDQLEPSSLVYKDELHVPMPPPQQAQRANHRVIKGGRSISFWQTRRPIVISRIVESPVTATLIVAENQCLPLDLGIEACPGYKLPTEADLPPASDDKTNHEEGLRVDLDVDAPIQNYEELASALATALERDIFNNNKVNAARPDQTFNIIGSVVDTLFGPTSKVPEAPATNDEESDKSESFSSFFDDALVDDNYEAHAINTEETTSIPEGEKKVIPTTTEAVIAETESGIIADDSWNEAQLDEFSMKSSIEVSPTADATNSVQLNPSTASTVLPTTALPPLGHIQKRNVSAAEVVLADESMATEPTPKSIEVENEPRSKAAAVDEEQEPEFNIDTFVSELLTNADEPSSESHDESVSKNLQDELERKGSPMTVEEAIENFISVPDMADVVSDESSAKEPKIA
ncbi:hypothetical protein TKK_0013962 [Trichogramma kaykai]|uniref:Secreted protein n=1 Tax=Trichogramma kaykai TaxID=54128 RepID=A0ABD2WGK0_9HYME